MTRRTKKKVVAVLALGGLLALGGFIAGPSGRAGAAVTDPVSYVVGGTADGQEGVRVFFTSQRNASCSVTRVVANETGQAVRTLMWVTWDGQLEPVLPKPGTSAMDGDDDLAAGEANTIVFTNDDHISSTASGLTLHMAWTLAGEGIVVAQHAELIDPCVEGPPVDTTPPTVDTVPPAVPPSVVEQVPGPDPTLPSEPGPAPSTTATTTSAQSETVVLGSAVGPMTELPNTGAGFPVVVVSLVGVALVLVGLALREFSRHGGLRFPKDGHR